MFWSWLILKLPRLGHPEFEPCSLDSNHPSQVAEASKLAVTSLLLRETYTSVVLCRDLHMFTGGVVNLTQKYSPMQRAKWHRSYFSLNGLAAVFNILGQFDGICEQFLGGAGTTIWKVDVGSNRKIWLLHSRQLHGHVAACPRIVGNSAAACGEALYFWMWRGKLTNNLSRIKQSKGDDSVLFVIFVCWGLRDFLDYTTPCEWGTGVKLEQMTQASHSHLPHGRRQDGWLRAALATTVLRTCISVCWLWLWTYWPLCLRRLAGCTTDW